MVEKWWRFFHLPSRKGHPRRCAAMLTRKGKSWRTEISRFSTRTSRYDLSITGPTADDNPSSWYSSHSRHRSNVPCIHITPPTKERSAPSVSFKCLVVNAREMYNQLKSMNRELGNEKSKPFNDESSVYLFEFSFQYNRNRGPLEGLPPTQPQ